MTQSSLSGQTPDCFIVGGDGTIGSVLVHELTMLGYSVLKSTRRKKVGSAGWVELDLGDFGLNNLPLAKTVILLAAETSTAKCQKHPYATSKINLDAQLQLIKHYQKMGAHIVFVSTAAVFSGESAMNEDSRPDPVTVYGFQKFLIEDYLRTELPHLSSVVRFGKVMNTTAGLFLDWYRKLKANEDILAFEHLKFSPILVQDCIRVISAVIDQKCAGIFHYSANNEMTYYDAACYLSRFFEGYQGTIRKQTTTDEGLGYRSSKSALLGSEKTRNRLKLVDISCEDTLTSCIRVLEKSVK